MKDLGQLCCCGVKADRHPTTICEKFHNFDMNHYQRPGVTHTGRPAAIAKALDSAKDLKMPKADRELLHLLAMKAVWPRGAGRQRFKTELHLDRAIEQCLDKALLKTAVT